MSGSNPDDDDVPEVTAPDDLSALFVWLNRKLLPDDMSTAEQLITNLVNSFGGPDDDLAADRLKRPRVGILARDEYTGVNTVINRDTIREIQAIRTAEAETGILGLDSAFAIYTKALQARGQDTSGLHGSAAAARTIFRATRGNQIARIGMDAQAVTARASMFPNANRLYKGF